MMLALAAGQLRAETETNMPYVIYDSGSKTLYFLCNTGNPLAAGSEVTLGENTTITIADGYVWSGEDVMNKIDDSAPDWNSKCRNTTKVVFEPSFANAEVKCCHKWFQYFMYLTTVTGLEYLKTSNETNMSNMFYNCESLTSLDLSSFDTSNVTDMSGMFSDCEFLTSLYLSGSFKTSNVTNMSSMFSGCRALTSLDLNSFDTSKVTDMSGMFNGCSVLTSLDLSKFDTSNLISMDNMFNGCNTLKSLVFGQLNTSIVMSMSNIFKECVALQLLDLSKATGDKIPDMIGTLPNGVSPVIFVPSGITLGDRNNVISPNGGTCDNLEIDAFSLTSLSFPYSFKANKITFRRIFTADKPHTLYLPFAIDATAYGTFYTLKEYDKENQNVVFGKITADMTTANTPYLFVPNETTANNGPIVIDGGNIDVKATTDATQPETGLIGVYKKHTFDDTNKANCYGWANDKFMRAGSGASVGACRAYLKLPAESVIGNAPASLSIQLGDGTTGITAVKGGAYGDSDAPMYNLQGQRVDKSYRGVVIKNGKKMIIK